MDCGILLDLGGLDDYSFSDSSCVGQQCRQPLEVVQFGDHYDTNSALVFLRVIGTRSDLAKRSCR